MPSADSSTISDASQGVSYLEEISPQLRGCAILAESGEVLAASGDGGDEEEWGAAGRDLLAAADSGGERVAQAHVATADGEAFCVRENGLVGVAVTERFVLSSLMVFDLRSVLRELGRG